jgi:hypothetical protein
MNGNDNSDNGTLDIYYNAWKIVLSLPYISFIHCSPNISHPTIKIQRQKHNNENKMDMK